MPSQFKKAQFCTGNATVQFRSIGMVTSFAVMRSLRHVETKIVIFAAVIMRPWADMVEESGAMPYL